jgi:hypothetical protein
MASIFDFNFLKIIFFKLTFSLFFQTTIEYGFLTEYGATFIFLLAGKFLGPKTFSSGTVPLVFVGLKKFGKYIF